MRWVICSKCGKLIKEEEKYVPYCNPDPQWEGFKVYGLTFMNFCLKCAEELNLEWTDKEFYGKNYE